MDSALSLVEQARKGDRDAFASLIRPVSNSLNAVAFRILPIDTDQAGASRAAHHSPFRVRVRGR